MVTLNNEALKGLTDAVGRLLGPEGPGVERSLLVSPVRVIPTGVGGFVGINAAPIGEIRGRRVEAELLITLGAGDTEQLDAATTVLARSLVGPDRVTLLQSGILRLALADVGRVRRTDDGAERDLRFSVFYEFLRIPEEAEDIIQVIPIALDLF
jgi:hypothetical protein